MQITPDKAPDIDGLIEQAVFGSDEETRQAYCHKIRDLAASQGIFPASIHDLYDASGKGLYHSMSVPAINIRGITYHVAKAVFRTAKKLNSGAFIFEIARSEIDYTLQRPGEYSACILGAAAKEGYQGPVFIQGDHFQVRRRMFREDPEGEINNIKDLIQEAVSSGFLNIDIDASTLVEIDKADLKEQQANNSRITAEMTSFIRSIQPEGVTISVGGEIGEIGKGNSTVEDLRAFMDGYLDHLGSGTSGISKISVQTGTSHGGVVLADGSMARVKLDFGTLKTISQAAREEYGLGGAVQHGASTLPDEAFDMFPKVNTLEVHLATGFQNLIYDSPNFPEGLLKKIYRDITTRYSPEKMSAETDEQFIYRTRKKSFGDFKKEIWDMPRPNLDALMREMEDRFTLIFSKLNAVNTVDLVKRYVSK